MVANINEENCDVALLKETVDQKNLSELKGFYEKRGTLLNFYYNPEKDYEENVSEYLLQMIQNFKF